MSRMVRESQVSGLRERLFFAQWTLRQLNSACELSAPRGELLAQRAAVIFHLYSCVVGLARQALRGHPDLLAGRQISLAEIEKSAADIHSPDLMLISEARADRNDAISWLDQEALSLFAASGMARRAQAPVENALAIAAENPDELLASGDLERLASTVKRVQRLLDEAASLTEEW
ncbi:hypothetical protein [Alcanivorax sp. 1008]|uniref:hypothetical protein n=1 Tax=Alcanivorax sp. 1008 TaxID=2816853 RepID=UPI001D449DB0|nr:hypothetical protein [Alcanivorax sp. 1008]MCC1497192.1 hypothetical protein [Alcanivorax sp. 1008]